MPDGQRRGPRRILSSPTTITVRPAATSLPSWVPNPGQFTHASLTTPRLEISPFYAAGGTFGGNQGEDALFNTWNGGAYVPTIGTLGSMFYWGGGHYGYYGDDILRFDIETRAFSRWLTVSPYAVTIANGTSIPDDTGHVRGTINGGFTAGEAAGFVGPAPIHTYSLLQYLSPAMGGAAPLGSFMVVTNESTGVKINPAVFLLDLNTKVWTRPFSLVANPSGINSLHGSTCIDTKRNVVWYAGGEERYAHRVNINGNVDSIFTGQFSNYAGSFVSEAMINYIPSLDCLFAVSQGTTIPNYWGIDLSSSPTATSSTSACTRHQLSIANPTLDPLYRAGNTVGGGGQWWEVVDNKITVARPISSTVVAIFQLTPPAPPANWKTAQWTWSRVDLTPKLPTDDYSWHGGGTNGLYSKMRYISAIKSILYGPYRSDTKVVACRHPDWI